MTELPAQVFRADLVLRPDARQQTPQAGAMTLSPDGRRLAFARAAGDLAVHDFESGRLNVLAGTSDAAYPFWSPDGKWLAFFAGGQLKKIAAGGGPVEVLCDAPSGRGGSWSAKGVIVFAADIQGPLMKIPESGGRPQPATRAPGRGGTHRNPHFLPDST